MQTLNPTTNETLVSLLLLKNATAPLLDKNNSTDSTSSRGESADSADLPSSTSFQEGTKSSKNEEESTTTTAANQILGEASSTVSTMSSSSSTSDVESPITFSHGQDHDSIAIDHPKDKDILSGRGSGVNLHPGNIFFRDLIRANKESYVCAKKTSEKKLLVEKIVEAADANGHRFLKKIHPKSKQWMTLTFDEAKKKTAQALRENAHEVIQTNKEQQEQGHLVHLMDKRNHHDDIKLNKMAMKERTIPKHKDGGSRLINVTTTFTHPESRKRAFETSTSSYLQNHLINDNYHEQNSPHDSSNLPSFNEVSPEILYLRLKDITEKQIKLQQLARDIEKDQRQLMNDLLVATQGGLARSPTRNNATSLHHHVGAQHRLFYDNIDVDVHDFFQEAIKKRRI